MENWPVGWKNCFNIVGGQLVDNCTDSVIHMEEDDDDDDDEKNQCSGKAREQLCV